MMSSSFLPSICAFAGVVFAAIAIIDFTTYVAARYRERYLQEARTELDDILIQIPASRVLDISIAFSAVGVVLSTLVMTLSAEKISVQTLIIVSLTSACVLFPVPRFILRYLKVRRLNKFSVQLEDALNMISGALKAGFSINQALEEVADQDIHPLSVEFRLLTQEIRLGVSLEQALDNMSRRLESDDFELVAVAISTARKTGGELTGTLSRVAGLIRERVRIAQKVRALTAMGRLQAVMIGLMPYLLLLGMYHVSPALINSFFSTPAGAIGLIAVTLLDIAGFFWIRKITKIEV
ncbi:MAG: type II secretion system F family protein [Lentisphaeria bacterium]|nr:type II secretion system F family protein [Lentisphaeria bacterium]